MHPAQHNEFVGAYGRHHILSPIGYGMYLKTVVRGTPVRSAVEQYEIQQIAQEFDSNMLYIPKVIKLISTYSYTMEQIFQGNYIPSTHYRYSHTLLKELVRFYFYMNERGYFPFGYTILALSEEKFTLFDFSQFGTLSAGAVFFKHCGRTFPILQAEMAYGLVQILVKNPEKIEATFRPIVEDSDAEAYLESSCAKPI